MAKDKLYITISDNRGGEPGGVDTPDNPQNESENEKQSSLFNKWALHEAYHFVKNQAMKAVDYSLGNIGNFTGDYIQQKNVNELRSAANALVGIATSTAAGAKIGGGWGALIGFALGVGSTVISGFYEHHSNVVENQKTNYAIEQLRKRSGLNTLYDGSRGTEN